MGTGIVAAIGSMFLIIIGLWKYFGRKATFKRQLLEEAKKELEDAQKNDSASGRIDAWGKSNGMR